MPSPRSLIGNSGDRAVVVSLPSDFNLKRALSDSKEIWLATAFGKRTGWKLIRLGILASNAQVRLLTGLDFLQTEPELLKKWLQLSEQNSRIKSCLASRDSTFHPKVLIVKSGVRQGDFAIVGSGNLTKGGFRTNTECSVYTADPKVVSILEHWFEERWKDGTRLTAEAIKQYSPKYKKAKALSKKITSEQKRAQNSINKAAQKQASREKAVLRNLTKGVVAFKNYHDGKTFKEDYAKRRQAAESIRKLLHIPNFDFNRNEFNDFYKIGYLGSLREGWKDRIFKQEKRLKRALMHLVDERFPIEARVDEVLEGANRVTGLGRVELRKF